MTMLDRGIKSSMVNKELTIDSAMDAEYNLRKRHPERTDVYREFSRLSELTRKRPTAILDISYGNEETSKFDLFMPENVESPPLLIFIHGGYWRALDKHNFSFLADAYLSKGVAVAIPNYSLVPNSTVSQIIEQVRLCILWLANNGDSFGYDENQIIISGHSAGAHMAAKMSCKTNMQKLDGKVAGYVGLSSIFDLEPLFHTTINKDLCLSRQQAKELSLYDGQDFFDIPILLAVGGRETVGFQEQTLSFSSILEDEKREVHKLIVPNRTHFDLLIDFSPLKNQESELFTRTLEMVGIK